MHFVFKRKYKKGNVKQKCIFPTYMGLLRLTVSIVLLNYALKWDENQAAECRYSQIEPGASK